MRNEISNAWNALRQQKSDIWVLGGFIAILGLLAWFAARTEPVVYDALTYRLSRIGQWLQDGRLRHFQTDDPRLNYMPVAPDLVIAWLLGATVGGFKGAAISQMMGGTLLLMATVGLARLVGLGRWHAWAAAVVVLGMGNVAAQFAAVQSDLFAAGLFAASYLLFHRAIISRQSSWLAGIGLGLAWSSKGTMFYVAPGVLLWLWWLGWRHWTQRKKWLSLDCSRCSPCWFALFAATFAIFARTLRSLGRLKPYSFTRAAL